MSSFPYIGAQAHPRTSPVLHILQPLDPAGLDAGLAGVLLGALVGFGLAGFAALLLLAFGHGLSNWSGMPRKRLTLVAATKRV